MKNYHILILLSFCLGLSSCMSVPIGTMIRMRGFGPKQFAALDPNEIQMKIQVPAESVIVPEKTFFAISVSKTEPAQEKTDFRFSMQLVRRGHETTGWLHKERKNDFILRLTPQGISDFVRLQQYCQKEIGTGHGSITISASTSFDGKNNAKDLPDQLPFSVFLKLAKDEDFFTLIDDATVSFKSAKNQASEPNQITQPEISK
jgi:hypothetical protein